MQSFMRVPISTSCRFDCQLGKLKSEGERLAELELEDVPESDGYPSYGVLEELPVGLEDLLTQILKSICDQVDLSTKLYVTGMDDPRLQTAIKLELTGEGVPEGLHYIQGDRDRPGNDKITAFALLDRKLTDESGADVLWPSEEEPMSCPLGDFQAGDTLGVMVNTEGTKYEELIPSFSFTASLKAGGDPAVITSLTLGHDSKAYQYELEE